MLAFDPSVEAERLRRHELASGRAMARSLDTLFKLRRANSSVVSGPIRPLSVVRCPLLVAMPRRFRAHMSPNEPIDDTRKRDERTHRCDAKT